MPSTEIRTFCICGNAIEKGEKASHQMSDIKEALNMDVANSAY
jgi:hypothetical protein